MALVMLALFTGALALVAVLKLQHARQALRSVWDPADPSLRRLLVFSALPGVGVALWFGAQGLEPGSAVVLGILLGLGLLSASAGVLGVERALLETTSEALMRRAAGRPLATSAAGRATAIALGCGLVGLALWVARWLG